MPVFLALIMTMLKPEMMIGFFLSPVGAISVLATIVLIVLGWWMISKIVKIDI